MPSSHPSRGIGLNVVKLTPEQLEQVRRSQMEVAVRDLEHAAEQLGHLAEVGPWPAKGTLSSDVQTTITSVRESLDALDALGWPRDETFEEALQRGLRRSC